MSNKPLSVDLALIEAKTLARNGAPDQARQLYQEVLNRFPGNKRAIEGLESLPTSVRRQGRTVPNIGPAREQISGLISLYNQGQLQEALEQGTALAEQYPTAFIVHNILGAVNAGLGRPDQAVASCTKAVQINPDYAEAHNDLGNALRALGKHDEAVACYTKALQIKPDYAKAHFNLGTTLKALGKHDEAVACYTKALQIKPDYVEAHHNLGNALVGLGKHEEAIPCFTKALQIRPDHAKAHNSLGIALISLGKHTEAIASYTKALQSRPDYAKAHHNLGNAFNDLGKREQAIACYTNALQIKPDFAEARSQRLYQQALICQWASPESENSTRTSSLAELGISGTAVPPFGILSFEDHPERHRKRSERYAEQEYTRAELLEFKRLQVKPDQIRIGYFSADFQDHPVMHLTARMFELHDRSAFRVHAYSFGPRSSDPLRSRLEDGFDVFHDVRMLSDKEIAQLARDEGIDIAIDLTGYTKNSRTGILAYRAAPVQVNYLGYPGTMGAPFIDYIVADKTLIPQASKEFYSEKVIYLPHSYQPQDNTKPIADRTPSRAELGLPKTGFVFCCFNNTYKITPAEFDIWMRLLDKIEGSVMWLFRANPSAEKNLLKEAQTRGIDPKRLIFADRAPHPDYLARLRVANLFLDTFNYNAGATASNALWAGLPVLTKTGEGYAARMAGSLLNAIDLPELITTTEAAYESLALNLATNPQKLQAIKAKLLKNRNTKPLFDTALYTQHLEQAYRKIYDLYYQGAKPEHITIAA